MRSMDSDAETETETQTRMRRRSTIQLKMMKIQIVNTHTVYWNEEEWGGDYNAQKSLELEK